MKRRNVLIAAVLVGFLTMVSVNAAAQKKKAVTSEVAKAKTVKAPEVAMKKKMVLNEAAQLSPAMLLCKAKELELTESQQAKLVAIMKEMQARTMAVLTKAQAAKVKAVKPASMTAKKVKMAQPTESAEPSGTKTKIAKAPDDTKSQAKKMEK